ncbi:MAG TPA: response regulator transcription factor [Vicinamibacterales bacterium]
MSTLRILLADDHRVMREGLRMVLAREPNMEVVGEANNGAEAISLTEQLRPDIVVMDVSMPEINGLKATEALGASSPETKILILTRHGDASYVQRLLQAGANGYVLKQSAAEELVRAIRRVVAGQKYLDPAVTDQIIGTISVGTGSGRAANSHLSRREQDVLRFVALGFLSKEIAAQLGISIKTVETHKTNAMIKAGLKNRIGIVRYAMLQGWLQDG